MKILWGFEPRSQTTQAIRGMNKLLRQLAMNSKNIEVGYVVTENEMYLHTAYNVPLADRFTVYPKKLIMADLRGAKVTLDAKNVQTVHHPALSTTKAVDRFLALGKARNADLIALYSHNKKGISRLVLGSFAETAVHRSKTDLLIAGPKTKYPSNVRSILFACDFGSQTRRDLKKVMRLCKQLGAKLTVLHATEIIYKWSLDESNPKIHAYRRKTDRMAKWIEQTCSKARVPCSVVLKSEFTPVSELAFSAAKKARAGLIVVSAKVGPGAALMGGSVTRQIVRNGTYPVVVLKS